MEIESRFSRLHISEDHHEVIDESGRDRLSELPDSLILSILSFLSMIDVVRTTILSKRWKDLWATIPCLHFIISRDHRFRYADFIDGALAQWRGAKMLKFSLHLSFQSDSFHSDIDIDSWLLFAIEKQVEDLFIDLENWVSDYVAPQRLYSCSSITKLSLALWELQIEKKVQWNNLKSLTIRVRSSLREDTMNQLLCGAPHLEELVLTFLLTTVNLNIRSTTLKTLKISNHVWPYNGTTMLRIWAPNLVTLELSGISYCGCPLFVPSLTNAILSLQTIDWDFMPFEKFNEVFRSISHVEKLTLSKWFIKFLLDMKKRNMDLPLSNAKFLKLYAHEAEEILDVFHIFPKLMHTIVRHKVLFEPIGPYNFRSPSVVELKTVEITWSVCDDSIFRVIEYLLENAHKLEKMVLRLRTPYGASRETFVFAEEKVQSMPRSSPTAQLIIINTLESITMIDW